MHSKMIGQGFSLIELLLVLAIAGLLTSTILTSVTNSRRTGRDARRLAELKTLGAALEVYYLENREVPNKSDQSGSDTSRGFGNVSSCGASSSWSGTSDLQELTLKNFITELPLDPLNATPNCFVYEPHDDFGTTGTTTGVGACLWMTLEKKTGADNHNMKVGYVVGKPIDEDNVECAVQSSLFNQTPVGYECGPLDEIIGAGSAPEKTCGGVIGGQSPPPPSGSGSGGTGGTGGGSGSGS